MYKLAIAFSVAFSLTCFAHEGHGHGPSTFQPQKGGVIRSLETVHLEMLQQGKTVKVYIFDKTGNPADTKKYPVSATATIPKKKAIELTLTPKKDHWEFAFDAKGAHRYLFELKIKQGGHNDKVKWNIEPKHKH